VHVLEPKSGAFVGCDADQGPFPRRSSRSGASALWHACWRGDVPLTKLLLEHHAEAEVEGAEGGTPLIVAAQYGHVEVGHGGKDKRVYCGQFQSLVLP
jgi:ankyrin repeat protein